MKNSGDMLDRPGPERYAALMSEFEKTHSVWIAESDEHVLTLLLDEDDGEILPVWPSAGALLACLSEEQKRAGYAPAERTLATWREQTTPALSSAGLRVGAFPNRQLACPVVDPDVFLRHLDDAARKSLRLQSSGLRRARRKRRG